jgi:hypothetical protein
MKYRDVLMVFLSIFFICSLAYVLGVDLFFWFIPVILFVLIIYIYYKLWIEK